MYKNVDSFSNFGAPQMQRFATVGEGGVQCCIFLATSCMDKSCPIYSMQNCKDVMSSFVMFCRGFYATLQPPVACLTPRGSPPGQSFPLYIDVSDSVLLHRFYKIYKNMQIDVRKGVRNDVLLEIREVEACGKSRERGVDPVMIAGLFSCCPARDT